MVQPVTSDEWIVLLAIGHGNRKVPQISKATGFSAGAVQAIVRQLEAYNCIAGPRRFGPKRPVSLTGEGKHWYDSARKRRR